MRIYFLALAVVMSLAGCAGVNGTANGTHRGASAHTDIFRIPFPPS